MEAEETSSSECPQCIASARQIAALEGRIALLEQKLESALRAGKRQAAPFSRGLPKADPKRPGRKSGEDYGTRAFRAVPPVIDEIHHAPLPARCPRCGNNAFTDTGIEHQYQVEIPRRPIYRQFNVAVARCTCCRRSVRGRHPLQTSDALGCCASQIGPEAQSAVVLLNKELGLSQGKIGKFFERLFGIKLTRGGSCQIMLRAAERCESNYQAIVKRVRQSEWVVPDETGWRIGGVLAWLHVAVGSGTVVAYLIARQRGFEASALLIGEDYEGTMTHDGYASYERFESALHQTCIGHLVRRCREMLATATRGAVIFPRKVKALLQEALAARADRDAEIITPRAAIAKAGELDRRMQALLAPARINAANERLAKHLWNHASQLFLFLENPGIDATNHKAEQAIRPAVVNRKVWGGNRTEAGAAAQSILMSVLFTAEKLKRDGLQFVSHVLRSPRGHEPMLLPATG